MTAARPSGPATAALVGLIVLAASASAQDLYCGEQNCYDGKQEV